LPQAYRRGGASLPALYGAARGARLDFTAALMRRAPRRQRGRKPDMLSPLRDLIGPSATNWLIVAGAGLVFFAAGAWLPELIRRLFGKGRAPLL
jgi:hypothetical protein